MKKFKKNKVSELQSSDSANLNKRYSMDVPFEGITENDIQATQFDNPKSNHDDFFFFKKNITKDYFKDHSPMHSIINDPQRCKELNYFDFNNKFSQRSILPIDNRFTNDSVKDEMAATPNFKNELKLNDNTPLNNSCSENEDFPWKNKTITEKDISFLEDMGNKFEDKKLENDKTIYQDRLMIDECLSEKDIPKNPNVFKTLNSISYSIYDKSVSYPVNNINAYRMDYNTRRNEHKRIGYPYKMGEYHDIPHFNYNNPFKFNDGYNNTYPVSERMIVSNVNPKEKVTNKNNLIKVIDVYNYQKTNKMVLQSEKSIQNNEESIKTRYKIQNQLSKFNNGTILNENLNSSPNKKYSNYPKKRFSLGNNTSQKEIIIKKKNIFKQSLNEDSEKEIELIKLKDIVKNSIQTIDNKQFKKYKNLLGVLISLFIIGDIDEKYSNLTEEEIQILKIIMYRKFKKNIDTK